MQSVVKHLVDNNGKLDGTSNDNVSLSVMIVTARTIMLDVLMTDTLSKIKIQICDMIENELGRTRPDPELMRLMLLPWGPMLDNDEGDYDDDNRTLLDSLPSSAVTSVILLLSVPHWVRFEDVYKDEDFDEDEDYYKKEFHSYKPKELSFDEESLRVTGTLYSHRQDKKRRIRSVGGLRWLLKDITNLTTPAKVVMFALNMDNFIELDQYHISRTCETDAHDVLMILVKWDKFSYLFLRKLRKCLPDVPIVAATDMDIRDLELLTFLDTPPKEVPRLYGSWDLCKDCESVGVSDIDYVNIKWMGLRPSDFLDRSPFSKYLLSRFSFSFPPAPTESAEFIEISKFLLQHPSLCRKVEWVNELKALIQLLYHPSFPCTASEGYLPAKILLQDWV
ncbi:uncharacterized protein LOC110725279 [Chenopodium quinoa]|uniref:Uncharacterized protein n=1 Tax=Chenopodium quinoa TaxID=63459 RepID=A0A803M561_CHEQI|nr:uncharacterized protein LOC110725279 [Chenopodium quinoa]XP_021760459.1 uncharacterized protein LOC110725279 [Chenopodium quinoa]